MLLFMQIDCLLNQPVRFWRGCPGPCLESLIPSSRCLASSFGSQQRLRKWLLRERRAQSRQRHRSGLVRSCVVTCVYLCGSSSHGEMPVPRAEALPLLPLRGRSQLGKNELGGLRGSVLEIWSWREAAAFLVLPVLGVL